MTKRASRMYNEYMRNDKERQNKLKTLKQLSLYRETLLKSKVNKEEASKYLKQYKEVSALIKSISDELFGKIYFIK